MNNQSRTFISLQQIMDAVSGNPIAMEHVISYYRKYMVSLSLRQSQQINGSAALILDEFMYRRLETKLMEKVLTFELNR